MQSGRPSAIKIVLVFYNNISMHVPTVTVFVVGRYGKLALFYQVFNRITPAGEQQSVRPTLGGT